MRILIWKLDLESLEPDWDKMEAFFSRQRTYIYATQEKEKLAYFFEATGSKYLLMLILGVENNNVKKAWLGYCFPEDYTFNLKIDFVKQLATEETSRLKQLYELSTNESTRHSLETAPTYFFSTDLPQKELFSILFDLSGYSLHNYFAIEYFQYTPNNLVSPLQNRNTYFYACEAQLDSLAQKSQHALRPIPGYSLHPHRNEFQRDKERLVHSKAFRRMVDKAQVYITDKGDHYRTRITHTLEVSQIARAIARQLNLHEDLTEAIALGNDVGHTPFGHEGERQLDLIMSGKVKLAPQHIPENLGGFKHNYQSVRLLNYIEEKYVEHEGLNLTYQGLEGILKHTGLKKHSQEKRHCQKCLYRCFDINDFLIIGDKKELHLDTDFCSSLEGQIVDIADEIAQRGHDLDDGLASGIITVRELLEELQTPVLHSLYNVVRRAARRSLSHCRIVINEDDVQRSLITPTILNFFIERLIVTSRAAMEKYRKKYDAEVSHGIIEKRLIHFDSKEQYMLDGLEEIIKSRIINSQEVNCFDGKSAYIIRKLFKAYYCNPRQLPDSTISRISKDLTLLQIPHTNIRRGNKKTVSTEIALYQGLYSQGAEIYGFIKHSLFMRHIADLIGSMTDEYARLQFEKLYSSHE